MLAVHLDNLLFLLLLAVAGLFQLLAKAVSKRKEDQTTPTSPTSPPAPTTTKPIPRASPESDEERVRKLLEALGRPPASQTASPQRPTYRRRLVLPRVPPLGSPLPPLVTRPPDLPAEIQVPTRTPPIPIEPPEKPAVFAERRFEVQKSGIAPEPIAVAAVATPDELRQPMPGLAAQHVVDATRLLRSPSGLRDAIILREILGPPRGLRQLEVIGT